MGAGVPSERAQPSQNRREAESNAEWSCVHSYRRNGVAQACCGEQRGLAQKPCPKSFCLKSRWSAQNVRPVSPQYLFVGSATDSIRKPKWVRWFRASSNDACWITSASARRQRPAPPPGRRGHAVAGGLRRWPGLVTRPPGRAAAASAGDSRRPASPGVNQGRPAGRAA
jgi:hypothetical protein